jgi:hypothetical protein
MAAAVPLTLTFGPSAVAAAEPETRFFPATRLCFFDQHQAAVIVEATARLVPGPKDDPEEQGHPGAREAGVVYYLDTLLSSIDKAPERVYSGGPYSDRAGGERNHLTTFLPLTHVQRIAWTKRVKDWRDQYRNGIKLLDRLAGGDFAAATPAKRDAVLAHKDTVGFVDLLFGHTVEGMYGIPEYGGNAGLVGWKDISYPGDVQPRGYSPAQVSRSDGADPVERSKIVNDFAAFLEDPAQRASGPR